MSVNAQLAGGLLGFPEREAPVFVWPACPTSCNPVVYSLCFVWVTKATVHTHTLTGKEGCRNIER